MCVKRRKSSTLRVLDAGSDPRPVQSTHLPSTDPAHLYRPRPLPPHTPPLQTPPTRLRELQSESSRTCPRHNAGWGCFHQASQVKQHTRSSSQRERLSAHTSTYCTKEMSRASRFVSCCKWAATCNPVATLNIKQLIRRYGYS